MSRIEKRENLLSMSIYTDNVAVMQQKYVESLAAYGHVALEQRCQTYGFFLQILKVTQKTSAICQVQIDAEYTHMDMFVP